MHADAHFSIRQVSDKDHPMKSLPLSSPARLVAAIASAQSWSNTGAPTNAWVAITCSANGSNVVAAAGGSSTTGQIYTSTNAGVKWNPTAAPTLHWTPVASSADGARAFHLQKSPSLIAPVWTDVTNLATLNNSNLQNQIVLPQPDATAFYHLSF